MQLSLVREELFVFTFLLLPEMIFGSTTSLVKPENTHIHTDIHTRAHKSLLNFSYLKLTKLCEQEKEDTYQRKRHCDRWRSRSDPWLPSPRELPSCRFELRLRFEQATPETCRLIHSTSSSALPPPLSDRIRGYSYPAAIKALLGCQGSGGHRLNRSRTPLGGSTGKFWTTC